MCLAVALWFYFEIMNCKIRAWCMRSRRVSRSAGSTRDVNIAACLTSHGTWSAELSLFPDDACRIRHYKIVFILSCLLKHILNLEAFCASVCSTDWRSVSLVCNVGTVMGGCVGRSRMDAQGSARSSTRSKKRGGKRLNHIVQYVL